MSTPTEFEDRFAIRELIDRWSDAVNERDWEQFATCFTENGVWDVGAPFNMRFEGSKSIVDDVSGLIMAQQIVVQMPHAAVIKLHGDTATARVTMHEFMRGPDGSGMQMWGTYYDDLVRTPAGWRFTLRRFRTAFFDGTSPVGDIYRSFGEIS
jgi:uncharacterized protein (TIGR02246 family)